MDLEAPGEDADRLQPPGDPAETPQVRAMPSSSVTMARRANGNLPATMPTQAA